jgi:hypothetical protein
VTAEQVELASGSRLSASAGNITIDGVITSGATVQVLVSAGNAALTLPTSTPAHLDASTDVGNLSIVGWPIPVASVGFTGHRASDDLSLNPSAHLTVHVATGNITIQSR